MNIFQSPSTEAHSEDYEDGYADGVEQGIELAVKCLPNRIAREFIYTHLLQTQFNYSFEVILEKINKLNQELNDSYTG